MHPDDEIPRMPRVRVSRNRSCFLLGGSWSHHASFPQRVTHFYLGFWVLSLAGAVKEKGQ